MAKVSKVTVTSGRTINLGNYNSLRLDVMLEAELDEADEGKHREAIRGLYRAAREELERQATEQLDAIQNQEDVIASHPVSR